MNKFFLMLAIFFCCVSDLYSQKSKSSKNKNKQSCVSKKKTHNSVLSDKSVLRNFDMESISSVKNGDVFIVGRNTSFKEENGKEKIRGYSLFVKISNGKITFKGLPFINDIWHIFFVDNLTGWVSGLGGAYKTIDGGNTWTKLKNADDLTGQLFFFDTNNGWWFSQEKILKRVKNDMVEELKSFEYSPFVRIIKKMQFTSLTNGWLMDVEDSKAKFQHTENGGKTWENIYIDSLDNSGVDDFQFLSESEGFAIASEGLNYTNDGGKSWRLIKNQTKERWFSKLFFVDRAEGWLIGGNSCFTSNGGESWKCKDLPKELNNTDYFIKGFVFTDPANGWLLTDKGLYFTQDGGNVWKRKHLIFDGVDF